MIQQAFETSLSGLKDDPWLAQRVLSEAKKEGEVVVKKKLSVALVVTIVLVLFSAVAVAAVLLWQDYVPQVKQAEHELGDYVEWPAAQRIKLASDLLSMGYINESEATAVLVSQDATEEEKALAADQMMLELTGLDDVKEIHSTFITYAIMGHEDTWTPEQRVWWNGIVTMYGDDEATDTLIVPTDDVLSEEDAITIAKEAVAEAYGLNDTYMATLHPVANLYVTDERPDYKRWDIQLKLYREGSTTWAEKIYSVIVDEDGSVIADPDIGVPHIAEQAELIKQIEQEKQKEKSAIEQIYLRYREEEGMANFRSWSLEHKAAYSKEVRPMVDNALSCGDLLPFQHEDASLEDKEIYMSTLHEYGLPGEGDISEQEALNIAYAHIETQYGNTEEMYRYVYNYFDVTDADSRCWRFVFYPNNADYESVLFCRVEISAKSGQIMFSEQFERGNPVKDEEYAMKLY